MIFQNNIQSTEVLPLSVACGTGPDARVYFVAANSVSNSLTLFRLENKNSPRATSDDINQVLLFGTHKTNQHLTQLGSYPLGTVSSVDLRSPTSITSCTLPNGELYFCVAALGISLDTFDTVDYFVSTFQLRLNKRGEASLVRKDAKASGELVTCCRFNNKSYLAVSIAQVGVALWEIAGSGKLLPIASLEYDSFFPKVMNCCFSHQDSLYIATANSSYNNLVLTRLSSSLSLTEAGIYRTGKIPQGICSCTTNQGQIYLAVTNTGHNTVSLFRFDPANPLESLLVLCGDYPVEELPQGITCFKDKSGQIYFIVLNTRSKTISTMRLDTNNNSLIQDQIYQLTATPTATASTLTGAAIAVTTFGEINNLPPIANNPIGDSSIININKVHDWVVINREYQVRIHIHDNNPDEREEE